jgi:glutamate formiminotransferase
LSVESVDISSKQTQFIKDLREELVRQQINIPVYLYETKIKKEDRIKFNLE